MSEAYESIRRGLLDAIDYAKGDTTGGGALSLAPPAPAKSVTQANRAKTKISKVESKTSLRLN
ncbi:MAG: hypothetical protein H6920_10335 [Sphingomonadaceae bacterium]|nr:hypothetical protein [Altererythrobacter sp.]MCP5392002.1 hypothetical protein [Sphingomonadaceae bacterium]